MYEVTQTTKKVWTIKIGDRERAVLEQSGDNYFTLEYPYSGGMTLEAMCELHAVLGEALTDLQGLPPANRDHEKAAPAF